MNQPIEALYTLAYANLNEEEKVSLEEVNKEFSDLIDSEEQYVNEFLI